MRIKELRENKGVSQKTMATALGIAQNTLSNWENGNREPDNSMLQKLADYFGVSVDYILGREAPVPRKGVLIPVLGQVAAGIPIEAVEDIIDYEEITKEMAATGEFFGLRIKGDSMEPKFSAGDVVIVRKQDYIESGEIAVVLVNGNDATVKKFVKHDNGISLVSSNPAFLPMFYTPKEVAEKPITILGKVVELRAKF